jgi:hypothetical protein
MENTPNQTTQSPPVQPVQNSQPVLQSPNQPSQGSNVIGAAGEVTGNFWRKNSFKIIRTFNKAIFWLINFIRFSATQIISQILGK